MNESDAVVLKFGLTLQQIIDVVGVARPYDHTYTVRCSSGFSATYNICRGPQVTYCFNSNHEQGFFAAAKVFYSRKSLLQRTVECNCTLVLKPTHLPTYQYNL
jgi:hypothetical protein